MNKVILHVDINNFYASAAINNNPALKGLPVAICGDIEKRRGIVLAKSEEAKRTGIKTGETIFEAKRKCPNLVLLPPDFKLYKSISEKAYEIYKSFTPNVESFGLDECWLDVTGCIKIFGSGREIAEQIRQRIKTELGITVSVGVSFTKVFAKLGSDYKKPDAVTVFDENNYKEIIWKLSVKELLYVGRATVEKLQSRGLNTIGDIAKVGQEYMTKHFGKMGEKLYLNASGLDGDDVDEYTTEYLPKSISNGSTFESDITDLRRASSHIYSLSEYVAFRVRSFVLRATGVSISVRYEDFREVQKQSRLLTPSDDAGTVAEEAITLLKEIHTFDNKAGNGIRALTVCAYGLIKTDAALQTSLFDQKQGKIVAIDTKIDKIRAKYGYGTIKRAIEITSDSLDEETLSDGGF